MEINPAQRGHVNPEFNPSKTRDNSLKAVGLQLSHSLDELDKAVSDLKSSPLQDKDDLLFTSSTKIELTEQQASDLFNYYVSARNYADVSTELIDYKKSIEDLLKKSDTLPKEIQEKLDTLEAAVDKARQTMDKYQMISDAVDVDRVAVYEALASLFDRNEAQSKVDNLQAQVELLERQTIIYAHSKIDEVQAKLEKVKVEMIEARYELVEKQSILDNSPVNMEHFENMVAGATNTSEVSPTGEIDGLSLVERAAKASEISFNKDKAASDYAYAKQKLEKLESELKELKKSKENYTEGEGRVGPWNDLFKEKEASIQSKIAAAKHYLDKVTDQKVAADQAYENRSKEWKDAFDIAQRQSLIKQKEIELFDVEREYNYYNDLKKILQGQLDRLESKSAGNMYSYERKEADELVKRIEQLDQSMSILNLESRKASYQAQIDNLESIYQEKATASGNPIAYDAAEKAFDYLIEKKKLEDAQINLNTLKNDLETVNDILDWSNDKNQINPLLNERAALENAISREQNKINESQKVLKTLEATYNEVIGDV